MECCPFRNDQNGLETEDTENENVGVVLGHSLGYMDRLVQLVEYQRSDAAVEVAEQILLCLVERKGSGLGLWSERKDRMELEMGRESRRNSRAEVEVVMLL